MSIARHHAEWLSLVPVSGPFLSLPVLMEAFPQGLDAHDAEHARLLRLAYEEWDDSFQKKNTDPSVHEAWIKFVLTKTLEFDESLLAEGQAIPQTLQVEVPEHGELLKPNIVLNDPTTKKTRMLVRTYPRSQHLTSYVAGSRWKASPETRMTDLLHGTGVRLGLVTNGEHWMLVDALKGETTGYASWYASLWREEKITLQAFRSLLSMARFFGVSDDQTIEALLTKSASNQQEVTEQLGAQVLRAVEVLIQSLDKADQDHGRELLEGVTEAILYESALTVMMRLVFLFCAEERELIPTKPFPVYEQNYSVSTISKQLREIADQHGEELLERRFDAWPRLLSSFRAVYGGLAHDDVYMPAYGGRLFDPNRFPFLEGRKPKTSWRGTEATPLPVNNRTVLHLLEALQLLQVRVPGGGPAEARRLSFRALDIEQIGHVYEGPTERTTYAMRIVAQRCLYGVDINPLATEMAKLSLWLLTLAKDKPFEFLDHAIRCGDSLVGLHDLEQLRHYSLKPDADDAVLFKGPLDNAVDEAINLRLKLEDMPSNTVEDVEAQEKLLKEAEDKIARLRCAADLLVAGEFWGEGTKDKQEKVRHAAVVALRYVENGPTEEFEKKAEKERRDQKVFHWPLEFPEVIVKRGGFDAFVGNPPFMGGKKITGHLGTAYRSFLIDSIALGQTGNADVCSYFFLRCGSLLRDCGSSGLVATNTIGQGETREVGLGRLVATCCIYRAFSSMKWPGDASLEVSLVWLRNAAWKGPYTLDGQVVAVITSYLSQHDIVSTSPNALASNSKDTFHGPNLRGAGFVLSNEEAQRLLGQSPLYKDVVFPYLSGDDLNSSPTQSPSRWAINFFDWDREQAEAYSEPFRIVEATVLPQRQTIKHKATREKSVRFFWRYDTLGKDLQLALEGKESTFVIARVTKYAAFCRVSTHQMFHEKIIAFPSVDIDHFAVLQSNIHELWAREFSSTLETRLNYTPSDCYETFPFPKDTSHLAHLGEQYHDFRQYVMQAAQQGLTKTYNRFHDPADTSADIQTLRDLHVQMDQAVAAAYGWTDFTLGHDFHETKQGLRFTISEPARREVLQRLLKLNHDRYAEEAKQGLHDKKKSNAKKTGTPKKSKKSQPATRMLFGDDDDEEGG